MKHKTSGQALLNRRGQALLMVLLSVGVVLTIALSVVARSITDVSTSTKDEESLRAFSAAEAGVEETLNTPVQALPVTPSATPVAVGTGNSTYTANLVSFPVNPREYLYPVELSSGDSATVWLSSHASDNSLTCAGSSPCFTGGTMDVCWGKTGVNLTAQPAIVLSVLYEDPTSGNQLKYVYGAYDADPSQSNRNHFTQSGVTTNTNNGSCTIEGTALANRISIDLQADFGIPATAVSGKHLKSITALILYNGAPTLFGVTNLTSNLPDQGKRVDSTGVSGASSRKVEVYSLYPEVPSMFQSALYSPPGIVK
jgi:Tfp pilus assembly protein PilX